jgi:hypothetical protein
MRCVPVAARRSCRFDALRQATLTPRDNARFDPRSRNRFLASAIPADMQADNRRWAENNCER